MREAAVESLLARSRLVMSLDAVLEDLRRVNVARAWCSLLSVLRRLGGWTHAIHLGKHGTLLVLAADHVHVLQHDRLFVRYHDAHLVHT